MRYPLAKLINSEYFYDNRTKQTGLIIDFVWQHGCALFCLLEGGEGNLDENKDYHVKTYLDYFIQSFFIITRSKV